LAKVLNCEEPEKGEPCGICNSCGAIDSGNSYDVLELDAASNNGVENMRDLIERSSLGNPGRHRVFILDEVHMLSKPAEAALLKTLEEPPDRAVIILVGTSLERQLPTIRSRCQIVRFQPLADENVFQILSAEAAATGSPADPALLRQCAAAAGGSLARARLLLDPELTAFRGRLVTLLSQRPLHGVELSRETIALVEAAGKEAPPRRARLRVVLEAAVEFHRAAMRAAVTGERPADPALAQRLTAWGADGEEAARALQITLDALQSIDRNANLTILVDSWTALLEHPSLDGLH
jgi:DNA polymerase III subunit gamma/tau